jgi:AraC family transcriptional regulator
MVRGHEKAVTATCRQPAVAKVTETHDAEDLQGLSSSELAMLAGLAGLSQSHYSRAFKASTGLAPYQWQLRARIAWAQGLLVTTNGSLEVIAEATGFADAVHFGRTFRKATGATPAA